MISRRRLLLRFALLAAAGAVVFGAWVWWTRSTDNITQAAADAMQVGMTTEQVVAIVGVLPEPGMDELWFSIRPQLFKDHEDEWVIRTWRGPTGAILTGFDRGGKLRHAEFVPFEPLTFRDRVRSWTGM